MEPGECLVSDGRLRDQRSAEFRGAATSRAARGWRFAALLVLIPACGLAQSAPEGPSCSAGEAQSLAGQPYSLELAEKARQVAGAREVRKIEPGGAYTMDLNPNRLDIEVDRNGVVTGLRCG